MSDSDPQPTRPLELAELHDATLDLVAASENGGLDALLRQLLGSIVGSGLSEGASLWLRSSRDERWIRHRSLGASGGWDVTPADEAVHDQDRRTSSHPDRLVVPLVEGAVLVVRREPLDLDGARDDREDAIECLALLAVSLVGPWTGGSLDGPAAPLPAR